MFKTNWKIYLSLTVILILFSNGRGFLARAATIEKIEIDLDKRITVAGVCNNGALNVRIFSATSSQPFYTAGADCHENKFEFRDDLGYWKIPEGDYSIAILGKDDDLLNSRTATFTIQSAIPTVADENIVEPVADLENISVGVQENEVATTLENPPDGLFAQIINFLVEWFKSAIVMIKELVVEKVSTPELCLGKTCIIEDQLKDLLGGKQKIEISAPVPEIQPSVPSSTSDVATTTAN